MRLKREENHNKLVSKKGFEPSRLKARAPKTLVTAISPLRDKLAYALSMMRLTKQVSGRRHKNYQSKENSLLIIARRPHNSPFPACPFLGCDRRRSAYSYFPAVTAYAMNFTYFDREHPTSVERNRNKNHLSIRL